MQQSPAANPSFIIMRSAKRILTIITILIISAFSESSAAPCSWCDVKVYMRNAGGRVSVRVGYQIRTSSGTSDREVNFDLATRHGQASFKVSNVAPCNSADQEVNYIRVDTNRHAHSCSYFELPGPFQTSTTSYEGCYTDQYRSCSFWGCRCKTGDSFKVVYKTGLTVCKPATGLGNRCSTTTGGGTGGGSGSGDGPGDSIIL